MTSSALNYADIKVELKCVIYRKTYLTDDFLILYFSFEMNEKKAVRTMEDLMKDEFQPSPETSGTNTIITSY